MQRVSRERGAVSVVVALLIVALVGFAAIGIDVAATAADRQQLQNGADSAALAIATDCAKDLCGLPMQTAQDMAVANKNDGVVTASVLTPTLSKATGEVVVQTQSTRQHWFAPVLGVGETTLTRTATAEWGAPAGGITPLPVVFSECEFYAQIGATGPPGPIPPPIERVVLLPKKSGDYSCNKPSSGNYVPGGFGYIDPLPGTCTASSNADGIFSSKPGNTPPSSCDPADFAAIVAEGKPVLIPLFDEEGGTGTNAWYHLSGYAAFKLTGYYLGGQYKTTPQPCSGSERCLQGVFLAFVDASGNYTLDPNAPDFGAFVIRLTS